MKCPECENGTIFVKDSRDLGNGQVIRRRECKGCGHVLLTTEIPDSVLDELNAKARRRPIKDRARDAELRSAVEHLQEILDQ